ncbi:MAG: radical SAM protein [Desulfomonile sp.]|nr:radical SAM protein [Desulfomonile sp.]
MFKRVRDFFYILPKANPRANINAFFNYVEGLLARPTPISLPLGLDLVLTKACNLRCLFCVSYGSLTGERWMSFELYERIAARLFWVAHDVFVCSGGEPLLYPRLQDAMRLVRDNRARSTVTTNGMLLRSEVASWMIEDQSVHELCISFDGARKHTLERIRRGADYNAILSNIGRLNRLKMSQGVEYPRMWFRFVAMRTNVEELPAMIELCARYGLYKVVVKYLNVSNEMDFEESLFRHPESAAEAFERTRHKADELGIEVELPPLPGANDSGGKCRYPWTFCQIDTDGSIRFCYHSWRQRIGFFNDDFAAVWRGEHYHELRRTVNSASPYYPYCRYCVVRRGYDYESAHHQRLHADAYVIPGLEHLQTPFNLRAEENRCALGQSR